MKNENLFDFILGLLTAAGLLGISKAIALNIELLFKLLKIENIGLQTIISQVWILSFVVLIALFLDLNIKFAKTFRYTFWIFLILGYLLYLYTPTF